MVFAHRRDAAAADRARHHAEQLHEKQHLLPRKLKDNGLIRRNIQFSPNAMESIVSEYTLEAGLRELWSVNWTRCAEKLPVRLQKGKKGGLPLLARI